MCGHILGPGMSFVRKPGGKQEVSRPLALPIIPSGFPNQSSDPLI